MCLCSRGTLAYSSLFCTVFRFCYQNNTDLIKWVVKCFLFYSLRLCRIHVILISLILMFHVLLLSFLFYMKNYSNHSFRVCYRQILLSFLHWRLLWLHLYSWRIFSSLGIEFLVTVLLCTKNHALFSFGSNVSTVRFAVIWIIVLLWVTVHSSLAAFKFLSFSLKTFNIVVKYM